MIGSLARVIVGALAPIALVDAILIIGFLVTTQRWSVWEETVGSIIGFSLILMLIPALLLSLTAEMILIGGIRLKWFVVLGGLVGGLAGIGVSTISRFEIAVASSYAGLGVVGGLAGACCMAFLYRREAANKALKSRMPDGTA